MRLTPDDVETIKVAVQDVFGASAAVRMFGSRVTDSARGGDIDLHIEADLDQQALLQSAKLQARLWQALDEMPVDVVVHQRTTALRWIDRIAMMGGIIL